VFKVGPLQGKIVGSTFRARSFNAVFFYRLSRNVRRNHPEIGNPADGRADVDHFGNVWQSGRIVGWFSPAMPALVMADPLKEIRA